MGVDISEPMLDVALRRRRSADLQVAFRKLDAQTGDIGHGLFDAAFSRFGVIITAATTTQSISPIRTA